jgi:hypothetical protein
VTNPKAKKPRRKAAKAAQSVTVTASEEAPAAKKIGRPSKYDPAMCETVLVLGEQGKSKAQIAKALEVTRETVDIWARKYPDFSDAIKRAHDLALAWWEDAGQAGLTAGQGNFNATAFIFQMKNRFRADYRDQQDHNHGVSDELGELLARIDAGPRNLPTA